ncbi:MAG: nucleotide exchange factor GrpE [Candidatus Eisenbacteria bacterium]|nr:nucleotide exchange factor GrpE [Candidatus Eisenbacteria bacterium]
MHTEDTPVAGPEEMTTVTADFKPRTGKRGRLKALSAEVERLREEEEAWRRAREEFMERIAGLEDEKLRLLAEMDNVRKRAQRRLEEDRWALTAEVSRPLLDVADNLERAISAGAEGGVQAATLDGIRMVHTQLMDVLGRYGVEPIQAVGLPFDFNVHEAIAHAPSSSARDNEVAIEVARGYLLKGKLLRPSKVIVARAGRESES